MSRLKEFYKSDVAPALMKKFNYKSPMQIPRLDKVIINCSDGEAKDNAKILESAVKDMETISIKIIMLTNEPFLWRIFALSNVKISISHLTTAWKTAKRSPEFPYFLLHPDCKVAESARQ